ncbi:hypothetical protein A4G28_17475 [Mycobacterium ostraviense]|uniref:Type VII secretion integral membrane protein EccD n=1 Tax=Mycobacterium ostraviense TaxID=2738409 RepID=A0A163YIL8_9MYCO|nr:hypothetical protein A4G28_17475 [Mycobacterium ostraviense]
MPCWAIVSAVAPPLALLISAAVATSKRTRTYDPVSETLSILAASGRGAWIMTAGFVVSGGCLILTAGGLRVLAVLPRVVLGLAGCCGLAVAALPDRLGTATARLAAAAAGAVLLAICPLLAVSWDVVTVPGRRTYRTVAVSAVLLGLLLWVGYSAWRGT